MSVTTTARGKIYSVNWLANDSTALASGASVVVDTPIVMTGASAVTNPTTGVTTYVYSMPPGNVRYLVFDTSANSTFNIYGKRASGNIATESLTVPSSGTTKSVNQYYEIYSITPTAGSGTVSIGYAEGQTIPFVADIWNKVNNYSIGYSNVSGTISVTPYYSLNTGAYSADTFYQFVITQSQFTYSPTGFTLPATQNGIFNITNIPLVTIVNVVGSATTGSFTLNILQQGAAY